MAAVNFDGFLTDAEFSGDLFVKQPADDQRHYFPLAGGERIMASLQIRHFSSPLARRAVAFERLPDGVQ